jgi:spore germination protein
MHKSVSDEGVHQMYRKWTAILFPVSCLALLFSLQWGTTKQSQMGKMKIEAENQYQRAFHDFVYQVGRIDDLLGKSEAIDGKSMVFQRSNAVQLVRLTSEAQNNLHQLPVSLMPDTNADDFFTAVYQFAHQMATADRADRKWQPSDQKHLQTLHSAAAAINQRMQHLQQVVLTSHLKWTDAETAFAHDGKIRTANRLYDGFHQLNTALVPTRASFTGPRVLAHQTSSLRGPIWTKAHMKQHAKSMLGPDETVQNIHIQTLAHPTTLPRYTIHATTEDGSRVTAIYAQQGGHLLWLRRERVVGKEAFTEDDAVEAARDQLAGMGFSGLVPLAQDRYDGTLTLLFAVKKGDVVHYPHRLTVQVGLDRGDVLGVQVSDNYYADDKDIVLKSKLSEMQAKSHLSPGFSVTRTTKVTLLNEDGVEVLGYAFEGQKNQHRYTIILDANTGQELHVDTEM